jgi:hypothetical protein
VVRGRKGLTDEHIQTLRDAVAAGRKPRVLFADSQFGDGATGQVVAIGDPDAQGPEYVSVRVKVDGVTDTLRFGPAELQLPSAARPPRTAARTRSPRKVAAKPKGPEQQESAVRSQPPPSPAAPDKPAATRPAAKRKGAASVTITLASQGVSWTVSAVRGGRSLVKAQPAAPGVVMALAELLGDEGLAGAVSDINEVARAEAEQRAERLRSELAEVESFLQSHERPGTR